MGSIESAPVPTNEDVALHCSIRMLVKVVSLFESPPTVESPTYVDALVDNLFACAAHQVLIVGSKLTTLEWV